MNYRTFEKFDFSCCVISQITYRSGSSVELEFYKYDDLEEPSVISVYRICFANIEDCKINLEVPPSLRLVSAEKLKKSELLDSRAARINSGHDRGVSRDVFHFSVKTENCGSLNIIASEASISLISDISRLEKK